MIPHHITESDYHRIAQSILAARYPQLWEVSGGHDRITLEDPIPGVDITVDRYEDGHLTWGGSYGYERERLWEVERVSYTVDSFEFFDGDGNERPSDFDPRRLVDLLMNGGLPQTKCA